MANLVSTEILLVLNNRATLRRDEFTASIISENIVSIKSGCAEWKLNYTKDTVDDILYGSVQELFDIISAFSIGGGGTGEGVPEGTERDVVTYDTEGVPVAKPLGWRQFSDLPTPPPFLNGVFIGTAFSEDGSALFGFLEMAISGVESYVSPNAFPVYNPGIIGNGGGTLPVANGVNDGDAVNVFQLRDANSKKADLDGGRVPESQLPSYVDNVQEYPSITDFPVSGVSNVVYLAIDTNKPYRWGGTVYVEITSGIALGETSATAYRGDRGLAAYNHSQESGNPHGLVLKTIDGAPLFGVGNININAVLSTSTANGVKTTEYVNRFEYTCKVPFNQNVPVPPAHYSTLTTTNILPVGITIDGASEHYISIRNDNRAVLVNVWDDSSRKIVIGFYNSWPNAANIAVGSVFIKLVKYK